MMTDIVERLHIEAKVVFDQPESVKVILEAADEIDRLRAENARLNKLVEELQEA